MNGDLLLSLAGGRIEKGLNVTIGQAIIDRNLIPEALALSLHLDRKVSFRVAWGLEYAYMRERRLFADYHGELTGNYLSSHNESLYRIYGKITDDLLRRGSRTAWSDGERIAEKAFDLLVSDRVMVASKVWAMEILYRLSDRLDWVAENLAPTIEHQCLLNPTPGMLSHSRKVLQKLAKWGL